MRIQVFVHCSKHKNERQMFVKCVLYFKPLKDKKRIFQKAYKKEKLHVW